MANKIGYATSLSTRAQKELRTSFIWYEQQQMGLGVRFVEDIELRFRKIEQNPELFSIKHKSYREASVPLFPYVIIYRINKRKKIIKIFSVFHTAQNPGKRYK